MKRRNLVLLLLALIFSACGEIKKGDIKGNWTVMLSGFDEPTFTEIDFLEDKVELIDDYLFKESGSYRVEDEKISISLNRDHLGIETKIENLSADTLMIFDSLIYYRNEEISNSHIEEYELLGIRTNRLLSNEKQFYCTIHFYKSESEEIKIRCGSKMANFDDIPLFLERSHSVQKVLIFLGKGIDLKDLKKLYFRLASIRQLDVWLATKREGISDTHVFKDNVEIWWSDLEIHLMNSKLHQPLPPPPPPELMSKAIYLKEGGEEVKISRRDDLDKIAKLYDDKRYVVSISRDLSVGDYLGLKKRLREKRNNQIVTEID